MANKTDAYDQLVATLHKTPDDINEYSDEFMRALGRWLGSGSNPSGQQLRYLRSELTVCADRLRSRFGSSEDIAIDDNLVAAARISSLEHVVDGFAQQTEADNPQN